MVFTAVFATLTTSMTIIWSFVFLFTSIFGYRIQRVGGNKLRSFNKKIKWASVWTEEDLPDQWIVGKFYIGYIYSESSGQHGGKVKVLYLFASHEWYMKEVHGLSDSLEKDKEITLYERTDSYWRFVWEKIQVPVPIFSPYQEQTSAIQTILTEFNAKNYVVCLLYGPPRTGKSNIPLLLAKNLLDNCNGVSFVDTFNPTDPNDSFGALYSHVQPTKDKPLIIVLEEVDGMILEMHSCNIKRHEHLPIQVMCKADWNKWLDRFDRRYYKNVILLMTSNRSLDWFNDLDASYFRDGRVNIKLHISHQVNTIKTV